MIDLESITVLSRSALADKYAELVEVVRELQRLQESVGWKALQDIIEANATNVRADLDGRHFASQEAVYLDQWMKGTVNGLKRVPVLLDESIIHYTRFRDLVATMLKEGQEDGSGRDGGSGGGYSGTFTGDYDDPDDRSAFAP